MWFSGGSKRDGGGRVRGRVCAGRDVNHDDSLLFTRDIRIARAFTVQKRRSKEIEKGRTRRKRIEDERSLLTLMPKGALPAVTEENAGGGVG